MKSDAEPHERLERAIEGQGERLLGNLREEQEPVSGRQARHSWVVGPEAGDRDLVLRVVRRLQICRHRLLVERRPALGAERNGWRWFDLTGRAQNRWTHPVPVRLDRRAEVGWRRAPEARTFRRDVGQRRRFCVAVGGHPGEEMISHAVAVRDRAVDVRFPTLARRSPTTASSRPAITPRVFTEVVGRRPDETRATDADSAAAQSTPPFGVGTRRRPLSWPASERNPGMPGIAASYIAIETYE